ncbi:MAG TPA: PEGA domain-containing protein [Thermoguttaceae bacterium]|nr:PEGA domain-containing protein [Thermoguttaceae bacterium]
MSRTLPWAAALVAIGLAHGSAAEPSQRTVPRVSAYDQRSTWLFVQTHPPGATIELGDERLGSSNGLFLAPPGLHTLTMALDGYRTERRPVEISEKRITRLVVEMQRPPDGAAAGSAPPAMPARPLVVQPRARYSVLKLAFGSAPPADEPPAAAILTGHEGQVNCVEFSPNGRILASAGADGTIRLWSVPSGSARHLLEVPDSRFGVYSVAFSPDGKTLASCSGSVVRLWDPETGRLLMASSEIGRAQSLDFSADGKTLIVATGADSLALCDTNSLKVQSVQGIKLPTEVALLGHDDSVRRITYSRDGKLLACGGGWHPQRPGRLTIWDTTTARLVSSFQVAGGPVRGVAFSPDTRLLAYAAGDTIKLVEMARLPRPLAR